MLVICQSPIKILLVPTKENISYFLQQAGDHHVILGFAYLSACPLDCSFGQQHRDIPACRLLAFSRPPLGSLILARWMRVRDLYSNMRTLAPRVVQQNWKHCWAPARSDMGSSGFYSLVALINEIFIHVRGKDVMPKDLNQEIRGFACRLLLRNYLSRHGPFQSALS